jgi:phage gp16-like protein
MAIHIKPSHEGRLHKDLGVKQGKKLSLKDEEEEKADGTPAEKKRAAFAINARSWHHGTPDEEREKRRSKMKTALRG